ncbi:hypothetical protein FRX31_016118 [Thalictrum thalictroides]|uniref:Uncharacterized protein n=1 Tax=Thalictrum thalictroides TaxID=46969 RepID=A0A7J6WBF3_THATH|nr:hypothetical protein FRX31_016118 [Thalictrum thalictroides]
MLNLYGNLASALRPPPHLDDSLPYQIAVYHDDEQDPPIATDLNRPQIKLENHSYSAGSESTNYENK